MSWIRKPQALGQSLLLALIAAGLRLPDLGRPHAVVFDETYYVKDGWSLFQVGYEQKAVDGADEKMLAGSTDILLNEASYVVHPPFGKWVIGFGENIFGLNPFGWRIMVALLGIIAVVVVHRVARRLFKHELTAAIAGLLMAIDGMAIVHSRTALLDQTLMFCMLIAFAAVVMDRDFVKAKLAGTISNTRIGFRPWLIVASVFLGLAIATKWSALWFVIGCGLLVVLFTARTRIQQGHSQPWLRAFAQDSLTWLPAIVIILFGVYLAAWSGWLLTDGAWDRDWAQTHPGEGVQWLPEALRSLLAYHQAAWNFHVSLSSAHSYSANPWTWPLQLRPTSFFYESYTTGKNGCVTGPCSAEVLALGNPLIWWAGTLALIHQLWEALVKRNTVATAIVIMFLVGWAPWLLFQNRTVFSFYSIVMLPFVCLALARSLGQLLGSADISSRMRKVRATMVGSFMVAVVAVSIFFLPLWTGETISYRYWQLHMWLTTWI